MKKIFDRSAGARSTACRSSRKCRRLVLFVSLLEIREEVVDVERDDIENLPLRFLNDGRGLPLVRIDIFTLPLLNEASSFGRPPSEVIAQYLFGGVEYLAGGRIEIGDLQSVLRHQLGEIVGFQIDGKAKPGCAELRAACRPVESRRRRRNTSGARLAYATRRFPARPRKSHRRSR